MRNKNTTKILQPLQVIIALSYAIHACLIYSMSNIITIYITSVIFSLCYVTASNILSSFTSELAGKIA